jgi:hypothetical protein
MVVTFNLLPLVNQQNNGRMGDVCGYGRRVRKFNVFTRIFLIYLKI